MHGYLCADTYALIPMRREATCVSKSHNNGGFSKHMWLLNGYGVISVTLFPSAALEKASQRQSKIHLNI